MHIGVAGNIGSGKTTLTRMLAEHYGWKPQFESVTYNPYLEDYYKDIPRDLPARCQLPDVVPLPNGRTIHRPPAWA